MPRTSLRSVSANSNISPSVSTTIDHKSRTDFKASIGLVKMQTTKVMNQATTRRTKVTTIPITIVMIWQIKVTTHFVTVTTTHSTTFTRMVTISQNHRKGFHQGNSRQRSSCCEIQRSTGCETCSSTH